MVAALPTLLLGLLALMLLAASWTDLASRTIPNELNLAIALGAIPFWWASGVPLWPGVALHVGLAVLLFALFAGLFAIGAMGGGDVKMIGALALWLPPQALPAFLVVTALAGGALTLAMVARHRWRRREGQPEIPYGVAIAIGGIWLISERFLYQFA